jgi:hypothetical protein
VRQQEYFDGGALDPRSNRLLPNPKHGPAVAGIEQLKAWAVVFFPYVPKWSRVPLSEDNRTYGSNYKRNQNNRNLTYI